MFASQPLERPPPHPLWPRAIAVQNPSLPAKAFAYPLRPPHRPIDGALPRTRIGEPVTRPARECRAAIEDRHAASAPGHRANEPRPATAKVTRGSFETHRIAMARCRTALCTIHIGKHKMVDANDDTNGVDEFPAARPHDVPLFSWRQRTDACQMTDIELPEVVGDALARAPSVIAATEATHYLPEIIWKTMPLSSVAIWLSGRAAWSCGCSRRFRCDHLTGPQFIRHS